MKIVIFRVKCIKIVNFILMFIIKAITEFDLLVFTHRF